MSHLTEHHVRTTIEWVDVFAASGEESSLSKCDDFALLIDRWIAEKVDLSLTRTEEGISVSEILKPPTNSSSATPIIHNIFTYSASKSLTALNILLEYCVKFDKEHGTELVKHALTTTNTVGQGVISIIINKYIITSSFTGVQYNPEILQATLNFLSVAVKTLRLDFASIIPAIPQEVDFESMPHNVAIKDLSKRIHTTIFTSVPRNVISSASSNAGLDSTSTVSDSTKTMNWAGADLDTYRKIIGLIFSSINPKLISTAEGSVSPANILKNFLFELISRNIDITQRKVNIKGKTHTVFTLAALAEEDVLLLLLEHISVSKQTSQDHTIISRALNNTNGDNKTPLQILLESGSAKKALMVINFKKLHSIPFTAQEIEFAKNLVRKLKVTKYTREQLSVCSEILTTTVLDLHDLTNIFALARPLATRDIAIKFITNALKQHVNDADTLYYVMLFALHAEGGATFCRILQDFFTTWVADSVLHAVFSSRRVDGHTLMYHAMQKNPVNCINIRIIASFATKLYIIFNKEEKELGATLAKSADKSVAGIVSSILLDNVSVEKQKNATAKQRRVTWHPNIVTSEIEPKPFCPQPQAILQAVSSSSVMTLGNDTDQDIERNRHIKPELELSEPAVASPDSRKRQHSAPKPLLPSNQGRSAKRERLSQLDTIAIVTIYVDALQNNIAFMQQAIQFMQMSSHAGQNSHAAYAAYLNDKARMPGQIQYLNDIIAMRKFRAVELVAIIFNELKIAHPAFYHKQEPKELTELRHTSPVPIITKAYAPEEGTQLFTLCLALSSEMNNCLSVTQAINQVQASREKLAQAKADFANIERSDGQYGEKLSLLAQQYKDVVQTYIRSLEHELCRYLPKMRVTSGPRMTA